MYLFQFSLLYLSFLLFYFQDVLTSSNPDDHKMFPNFNITGKIDKFTLILAREQLNGRNKSLITVNGTVPGPTLYSTLGNYVEVLVINNIEDDASSIHWHGMTVQMVPWCDGLINITQCPITNIPGYNHFIYRFLPQASGTFWYHGHYHAQFPDGLYGALIIRNPSDQETYSSLDASYEIDDEPWVFSIADYYEIDARYIELNYLSPGSFGLEPIPDFISVNNHFSEEMILNVQDKTKSIRMRFINAAAYSTYWISLDGIPLTIIELDGVSIEPVTYSSFPLYTAQRASVIVDWNLLQNTSLQSTSAIYLRMTIDPTIYPTYDSSQPNGGLYGYSTGKFFNFTWYGVISFQESITNVSYFENERPILPYPVPSDPNIADARTLYKSSIPEPTYFINIITEFYLLNDDGLVRAYINDGSFEHDSNKDYNPSNPVTPMLYSYLFNQSDSLSSMNLPSSPTMLFNRTIEGSGTNPFVLPYNEVIEVFIDGACCGLHPFHLHGHHFWIIESSDTLNRTNSISLHRDVVTVPFGGWIRLRFISNNPGIWYFHCHLHWHMLMGLGALFIEAPEVLLNSSFMNPLQNLPTDHTDACFSPVAKGPQDFHYPTLSPVHAPTSIPTSFPTSNLTIFPSTFPIIVPSSTPSGKPSFRPTLEPSFRPTIQTASCPTRKPHRKPTSQPSHKPSSHLTNRPSNFPTLDPTLNPTLNPTLKFPSSQPSFISRKPTINPSFLSTFDPEDSATQRPSNSPTLYPLNPKTLLPTSHYPTYIPSSSPSFHPTLVPSVQETSVPTHRPSIKSTYSSAKPSIISFPPSSSPSSPSHFQPTFDPSSSYLPSVIPSIGPVESQTLYPTFDQTNSLFPSTLPTFIQSNSYSKSPTLAPSTFSSNSQSSINIPSIKPTIINTITPSLLPSKYSTSNNPIVYISPSLFPTLTPTSFLPTLIPSKNPGVESSPSRLPTLSPSLHPIPTNISWTLQYSFSISFIAASEFLSSSVQLSMYQTISVDQGISEKFMSLWKVADSSSRRLNEAQPSVVSYVIILANISSSQFQDYNNNITSILSYLQSKLTFGINTLNLTKEFQSHLKSNSVSLTYISNITFLSAEVHLFPWDPSVGNSGGSNKSKDDIERLLQLPLWASIIIIFFLIIIISIITYYLYLECKSLWFPSLRDENDLPNEDELHSNNRRDRRNARHRPQQTYSIPAWDMIVQQ